MLSILVEYLGREGEVYQGVASSSLMVETYVLKLDVTMNVTQFMKNLKLAGELHANITKLLEC